MKTRIAIIEDEDSIREICKRYLEREGYEVYTAV
ncbi:DNA-binding response regulator, partial [Bacillus paramycoides]